MSEEMDERRIADLTEARTALPEALAEIRRLRALLGAAPLMLEALEAAEEVGNLQKPFLSGILHTSGASQEVKQEASDRLGVATRRAYELRVQALAAARLQAEDARPGEG